MTTVDVQDQLFDEYLEAAQKVLKQAREWVQEAFVITARYELLEVATRIDTLLQRVSQIDDNLPTD